MWLAKMSSFATVLIAWLLMTPATAQEAMTTRARTSLSPHAANRSTQSDLLSVFEPVTKIDTGMLRQLRGVELVTHPFGTEFEGVCERDTVSLRYAPNQQGKAPEDAPVRPYGVDAKPWFHIIKLAGSELDTSHSRPDVWQTACISIRHDADAQWFSAAGARQAVQGVLMLEAAVNAVRIGALKSEPCPSIFRAGEISCEAAILESSSLPKLDGVNICPADVKTICYTIDLATSTKLTIRARANGDALVPGVVISISIQRYIIVT